MTLRKEMIDKLQTLKERMAKSAWYRTFGLYETQVFIQWRKGAEQ